jgi:hypothetical protein
LNEMGKKVGACEARLGAKWTKQHECWREREYAVTVGRRQKRTIMRTSRVPEARLPRAWRLCADARADVHEVFADEEDEDVDVSDEALERAAANAREADRAQGKGRAKKSHAGVYMSEWLHFENFVLMTRAPDHAEYKMVMAWAAGDTLFDAPFSKTIIELYFRHLSGEKDTVLIGTSIVCRGLGYEAVCMAKKAITHFHRLGCRVDGLAPAIESYVMHPDVKMIVDELEASHNPEGAEKFELESGLRAMREALFGPDPVHSSRFECLYAWALILMMINHMARKSDFAEHVRLNALNPLWPFRSPVCALQLTVCSRALLARAAVPECHDV